MSEPSPGDALFSFYPTSASRPYLRRNVRKVLRHLTMGSHFSSEKTSQGRQPRDEIMTSEDEQDDGPGPAKRRRMNHAGDTDLFSRNSITSGTRQPFGQVTNGNARSARRLGVLPPSDFYGRSKVDGHSASSARAEKVAKRSRSSVGGILPEKPHVFKESLRVDFIELVSTAGNDEIDFELSRGRKVPFEINCRCSIAIFYGKNDENPGNVEFKDYVEICRDNKFCILRVDYGDHGEISRQVILPEPFVFTPENFYVNRKMRKLNGQFLSGKNYMHTFGFADDYNLQILIDPPLGFDEDWPPLAIQQVEDPAPGEEGRRTSLPISQALHQGLWEKDELQLFCKTNAFVKSHKSIREAPIQVCHKNTRQKLPYTLKLRMDWALPTPFTKTNVTAPKAEPRSTPLAGPIALDMPVSPISRMQGRMSVPNSPADERVQRKRSNVTTYNLKALSAQAQGKSPRKTHEPRSISEQRVLEDGEVTVRYCFHKAHAGEIGVNHETLVSGLNCPFCICRNSSLEELRVHLQTDHSTFKFSLRKKQPRVEFFVDLVRSRSGPISHIEQSRTYDMRKPKPLFNLEAYLGGDDSWARSRHGPQNNCWPEHLGDRNVDSSMSSSPRESRQSSPNTSADLMDFEYLEHHKSTQKPSLPKPKSFIIPQTAKPLYDTTTKQVLQPGDGLSEGDSDVDETWLHHRKHDLLNEFVDVAADEKEYLHRWNLFMVEQHLTSDKFLPQAIVRFAETNKSWIMETGNRRLEFMRHLEAFKLRGVLDIKSYHKCFWTLKSVEQTSKKGQERGVDADVDMDGMEVEPPVRKPRGPMACICGETPQISERYICRGQRCKARYFHRVCAENLGRPISGQWTCDDCSV